MKIALVQFREVGKAYYYVVPESLDIAINDIVVVMTTDGLELGNVKSFKEETDKEVLAVLHNIIRVADEYDLHNSITNESLELEVTDFVSNTVTELNLPMEIIEADYTLEKEKLTIFFEAPSRVDFRDLLRILNSKYYNSKIELRQIGARDVAKKIGGLGPCGLILCCSTFIGDFDPVSIKMAKNQNIVLNPKKISGLCGKLLCCLKYEDDVYKELKNDMPDLYSKIETDKGLGKVIDISLLRQMVKIKYIDSELSNEWIEYKR